MKTLGLVLGLGLVVACGDDTVAVGADSAIADGAGGDAIAGGDATTNGDANTDATTNTDGNVDGNVDANVDGTVKVDGAGGDSAMPDTAISCGLNGQACTSGVGCCSGFCDTVAARCYTPAGQCASATMPCAVGTDCCSLSCVSNHCATSCKAIGATCATNGDCCTVNCVANACAAIAGTTCATVGNKCAIAGDCCSKNCQGGVCASSGGGCEATGDLCFRATDCCTGICTIATGAASGVCAVLQTTCVLDGEPCAGCTNCCSRVCGPTSTGGHTCQPAGGCRVMGDLCHTDSDCCGAAGTGLPGAGEVTCQIVTGSNPPVGTCQNPTGCDPEGDVCGPKDTSVNGTCGNAREDCCDCMSPKFQCCKLDKVGVPRCYGGSTTQCPSGYTGVAPCCIAAGAQCTFSDECCGGSPCVPDSKGVFRCGSSCVASGGTCTATPDCCVGLECNIPPGETTGTCGAPPPPTPDGGTPDLAKPDMAVPPGSDLAVPPGSDLSVPPDLAHPDLVPPPLCPLLGQPCSTTSPCCSGSGLVCTPPTGIGLCQPGQAGCTCLGAIG